LLNVLRGKKDLEQLTLALCANPNGTDKIKIFVISKSSNPLCFKGVNHKRLGVKYDAKVTPETICNCFQYTGILPDTQDNEESFIDNNDDELIDELYSDIEALNFKTLYQLPSDEEILDLATNLEPENESAEDDNSTEMHQISHQEVLNAVEILEQYIVQNDFSKIAQFEHDKALLKLQKGIRKFRIASFKQTSIETYFELVD
ncbi:5300_t:CDS:2, partial [Dentiscutata erythropus]